jgi:hypothetical protein
MDYIGVKSSRASRDRLRPGKFGAAVREATFMDVFMACPGKPCSV